MKASEFTVHQLLIPSTVECMVQSVIGRLAIARIEGGWPVVETWSLRYSVCIHFKKLCQFIHYSSIKN